MRRFWTKRRIRTLRRAMAPTRTEARARNRDKRYPGCGLSLFEMAGRLRVPRRTLQRWEAGMSRPQAGNTRRLNRQLALLRRRVKVTIPASLCENGGAAKLQG